MKNKLTRKLMLSVFTLLFAVISLGASTYAWFTLSRNAKVEAFEASVTIGSGLNLQAVAHATDSVPVDGNWEVSSLTLNNSLYSNVKFQDITPNNAEDLSQGFVNVIDSQNASATGYICFDLFFKLTDDTDSKTYDLYFTGYTFDTPVKTSWTIDKNYGGKDQPEWNEDSKYSIGESIQYYAQDAARLGIVPGGSESSAIYQAPSGSPEFTPDAGEGNVNAALNYYNAVNPNAPKSVPDDFYTANSAVEDDGQLVGTFTNDNRTIKVTVYVWLEGWDAECINAIFAQKLSVSLDFYLGEAR